MDERRIGQVAEAVTEIHVSCFLLGVRAHARRASRAGGAHDRLGDRGAVDHLVDRDRVVGPAARGDRERFEGRTRHVVALRLPDLGLALDRLELAGAEEPRAPLLGRGAGDVRHSLQPDRAGRAEHLEAEPGPGRRHRPEVARHAVVHPEAASRSCRRCRSRRHGGSSGSRRGRSARRGRSSRRRRGRPSASGRRPGSRRGSRARRPAGGRARWGTSSSPRRAGPFPARPTGSSRATSSSRGGSGGCSRAPSVTPAVRVASTDASASALVSANGFSQKTCLPAPAAATTCVRVQRVRRREHDRVDLRIVRAAPRTTRRAGGRARRRTLCASGDDVRDVPATKRIASLPAADSTSVLPHQPSPTIAAGSSAGADQRVLRRGSEDVGRRAGRAPRARCSLPSTSDTIL